MTKDFTILMMIIVFAALSTATCEASCPESSRRGGEGGECSPRCAGAKRADNRRPERRSRRGALPHVPQGGAEVHSQEQRSHARAPRAGAPAAETQARARRVRHAFDSLHAAQNRVNGGRRKSQRTVSLPKRHARRRSPRRRGRRSSLRGGG
jgi:hypothetical protein